MRNPLVYHIGSLRNPEVIKVSQKLRQTGVIDVFDSWFAASPTADDAWKEYEQEKGLSYIEALDDYAAQHVYRFDLHHLQRADVGVLTLPAGKSGHLELGVIMGSGRPGFILLDDVDRWDVMYNFTGETLEGPHGVYADIDNLAQAITKYWSEKHYDYIPF